MNKEEKFIINKLSDKILEHCGQDIQEIENTLELYTSLEQTMMLGYLTNQVITNSPKDKREEIKKIINRAMNIE